LRPSVAGIFASLDVRMSLIPLEISLFLPGQREQVLRIRRRIIV
jgi:hypothetical protein